MIRTGLHNGSTEVLSLGLGLVGFGGMESSSCGVYVGLATDPSCDWDVLVRSRRVYHRRICTVDESTRYTHVHHLSVWEHSSSLCGRVLYTGS